MAWTHVSGQSAQGASGGTSPFSIVLPNNPTQGNLVCALFWTGVSGVTLTSIVDSNGNAYQVTPNSPSPYEAAGACGQVWLAYLLSAPANASKTITITASPSTNYEAWADEFNPPGAIAFDNDAAAQAIGSTINTPTVPVSGSNDLLYGGSGVETNFSGAGGGWVAAPTVGGAFVEWFLGASASTALNISLSGSGQWSSMGMSFKLAGAGDTVTIGQGFTIRIG